MSDTIQIDNQHPTRLTPGTYRPVGKNAIVYLMQGTGDGRREVSYEIISPRDTFTVNEHTNGFWAGALTDDSRIEEHTSTIERLND